jgi:dTDP-4-dehydrorhamnose 3,5-epimerase
MIDDIIINKLKTHSDERGFFREIFRFPKNFENIPVGQVSHSFVKVGVIKAWHGHVNQHQWNYIVSGQIKVVLIDNRKESNSYKNIIEFIAGENDNPISYYFPPRVLHSYKCIKGPLQIIYLTSGIYDLNDEIRIAPEELENIYNWSK